MFLSESNNHNNKLISRDVDSRVTVKAKKNLISGLTLASPVQLLPKSNKFRTQQVSLTISDKYSQAKRALFQASRKRIN